jgi:hypothetical protein
MIKNYFKIALRNLTRNKGYSFINIGGLALGMTVAMLIGLWVYDELSYNQYHQHYDRIGQLIKTGRDPDGTPWIGGFSLQYPLIDVLRTQYGNNFTHLVEAVQPLDLILNTPEKNVSANGQFMASDAPNMLTLDMISGTRDGLKDPNSIMLSESVARTLYGNAEATGQMLKINATIDVTVTGVYRDLPQNTHFHDLSFIAPFSLAETKYMPWIKDQDWENQFLHIYCEIPEGRTWDEVNASIGESIVKVTSKIDGLEAFTTHQTRVTAKPMKDWHLHTSYSRPNYGKFDKGPARMVWLVAIIGAFVLVLACINFMNLSTARSERRAREVGIRKSMGSFRRQLVSQFFAESYVVVMLAFACSLMLTTLSLPAFNELSGKAVVIPWSSLSFWLLSLAFVFFTGLLAGSYPALFLSSFNPVKTLKGTFKTGRLAAMPRKVLVVFQFTVSVALIISTIVVYNQILFAKDRPVGYAREGLILIQKKSREFFNKTDLIRQELKRTGKIDEVSESQGKIMEMWSNNDGFTWPNKDPNLKENMGTLGVTSEFGATMQWQFVAGRDFSADIASDSSALVINESAAKMMGMEVAINQTIHWQNDNWRVDNDFHIIGVIKDMVMDSPFAPSRAAVYLLRRDGSWINVRLRPGVSTSVALSTVESVFKKYIPSAPFEFEFADEAYAQKFAAEEHIASLASVFAVLAVIISCLGLFGLALFVAEQRTKEIGIRKVVGASVLNLWKMLSMNFVVLVIISSALAVPITYYGLSCWLTQYDYRIHLSPWVFITSVFGAIALTMATVSYQAIRVARMNPARSLKSE